MIAVRNGSETLPRALDAIEAQTLPKVDFELVVVDDGSTDGTGALVGRRDWVRLVSAEKNLGVPIARNLGVSCSRGALLAFTDADCLPDSTWLTHGIAHFERVSTLGALGGQIIVPVSKASSLGALVDASRFLDQQASIGSGAGVSANLWIRRDLFLSVGGFNEKLARLGYPDTELMTLLNSRGAQVEYAEDVRVTHPARAELREICRKSYRLGVGHAPFRRYGRVVPRRRLPLFLRLRRLLPRGRATREAKLKGRGLVAPPHTITAMASIEFACISAPMLLGDLVGTVRSIRNVR